MSQKECEIHLMHSPQATSEALGDSASPADDVPNRWYERALLSDRPQPEIAKPPTLNKPSSDELLKGALYGSARRPSPDVRSRGCEVPGARARQQPEDVRNDPAPAD
jgi:hypothetical protein